MVTQSFTEFWHRVTQSFDNQQSNSVYSSVKLCVTNLIYNTLTMINR